MALASLGTMLFYRPGSVRVSRKIGDCPPFVHSAPDRDALFIQKHKSVLDKLATTDVNHLTPLEAINLLSQIKTEIAPE